MRIPFGSPAWKPGVAPTRPLAVCPYCGAARGEAPESEEHVLPAGLFTRSRSRNPLTLPVGVHEKCNRDLGRHVDAPFLRNWLIQMERGRQTTGLRFFGRRRALKTDQKECDQWVGDGGHSVYHYHDPYPEDARDQGTVKPKEGVPGLDPGFAFIGRAKNGDEESLRRMVAHFRSAFKQTTIYSAEPALNGIANGQVPRELTQHVRLLQDQTNEITLQITHGDASGDRFLAKLALGFGTLFLRDSFPTSDDAKLLRDVLWERRPAEREQIPVGRTAWFGAHDLREPLLKHAIGDAHLFVLQQEPNGIFLCVILYGRYPAVIRVCGVEHATSAVRDTLVFVASQRTGELVGPLNLVEWAGWEHGLVENDKLAVLTRTGDGTVRDPRTHFARDAAVKIE